MKRIKLFENFNSKNPLDIRDDIKSVLYELEDLGLDVKFKAQISNVDNIDGYYNVLDANNSSALESYIESGNIILFYNKCDS